MTTVPKLSFPVCFPLSAGRGLIASKQYMVQYTCRRASCGSERGTRHRHRKGESRENNVRPCQGALTQDGACLVQYTWRGYRNTNRSASIYLCFLFVSARARVFWASSRMALSSTKVLVMTANLGTFFESVGLGSGMFTHRHAYAQIECHLLGIE